MAELGDEPTDVIAVEIGDRERPPLDELAAREEVYTAQDVVVVRVLGNER